MGDFFVIDAQLHEPSVATKWDGSDTATRHRVLTESLIDYMDAVGVDGVILHATKEDEWARAVAAQYPKRIGLVFRGRNIAEEPDVEERVAAAAQAPHQVGIRVVLGVPHTGEEVVRFKAGVYDRLLAAMEQNRMPLFLMATWNLGLAAEIAERHPDLTIILDHLGIPQPPTQPLDTPLFKELDNVLALARFPNLGVKFSGAPGLSLESFPFDDLWVSLRRYVDEFGADRLMWGTDISRYDGRVGFHRRDDVPDAYQGRHSYAEALYFVIATDRLSEAEKREILGGTAQRLLNWRVAPAD
jgi:L-fuconolactonase